MSFAQIYNLVSSEQERKKQVSNLITKCIQDACSKTPIEDLRQTLVGEMMRESRMRRTA